MRPECESRIPSVRAREAIAMLTSNLRGDIVLGERTAENLALGCSAFFRAIANTDGALADIAEGNMEKAVQSEEDAIRELEEFLKSLDAVRDGLSSQKEKALSSKASARMESALATGGSWEAFFDILLMEIRKTSERVTTFVRMDKQEGIALLKSGDLKRIIDETGPLAADMVRSVCVLLLTFVDSAVATHRALDKNYESVE